jgi:predicted NAD/FAD-dependent oxidoreductase
MTAPGHGPSTPVVVGAGIAGVACARALAAAGHEPRVYDRGRRIGGRMAVRTHDGRPVDLGASYFTAQDERFVAVTDDWVRRGLARLWTDTFHVATPEQGLQGTTTSLPRYATRGGLRSLVEDLADGLAVEYPHEVGEVDAGPAVDGEKAAAVVLAMPDPQALDLLSDDLEQERAALAGSLWEPVLVLAAHWPQRAWPELDGVFVNESPVLTFVADDGARRGDGAPVLVAHADPVFAAGHLDDPASAAPAMLAELALALGVTAEPDWVEVKRWGVARPVEGRPEPYHLGEAMVGLAGDGWQSRPRIEAAYLSGDALGRELAARLG